MKINLPVFKDEGTNDSITYQSWHWDLTVYHQAGCQDCTLIPYTMYSLQGYQGELVRRSGTDITLDDVLAILDKHYNNVKVLDALIRSSFSYTWVKKGQYWTGGAPVKTPAGFHSIIPRMFSSRSHSQAEA